MAKPILIVRIDSTCSPEKCARLSNQLTEKFQDYYNLVISDHTVQTVTFEVLNCSELNDISLEELKKIVEESLKQQ